MGPLVVFVVLGAAYWIGSGANPFQCLYGDPTCSNAFATYLMSTLTFTAFVAAFIAAKAATRAYDVSLRTFENERMAELGQRVCLDDGHQEHGPHCRVYLFSASQKAIEEPPGDFDPETYRNKHFDFTNLGRAPVRAAHLGLEFEISGAGGAPSEYDFDIGSLADHATIHACFYVADSLGDVRIKWPEKAIQKDGKTIDFNRVSEATLIPYVRLIPNKKEPPAGDSVDDAKRRDT
jgi:hypothetical protein